MHSLNGVLVMLSFLAQSKVNFKLPGYCPVPPEPSTLLHINPPRVSEYYTALHYDSETKGELFGTTRGIDTLNCLRLSFLNVSEIGSKIMLQDCDFYEGYFTPAENHYEIFLRNVDHASSCQNQTMQIKGMSMWADEKRDFIVFWSCSNDTQVVSHKQVVVVLINSEVITSLDLDGRPIDKKILERVMKYTRSVLAFSGLNVTDFDVNRKLMVDHYSECDNYNCSNQCDPVYAEYEDGEGVGGPMIFFIVICFVAIIVFMVVL